MSIDTIVVVLARRILAQTWIQMTHELMPEQIEVYPLGGAAPFLAA
jgi:hypothetical protein